MQSIEASSSSPIYEGKMILLDFGFKVVLEAIVVSHHATIFSMLREM
jgi:hypothetical protein